MLVPVGPLNLVPWHAAYRGSRPDRRYALADAVISYAASGRQLIEVSQRPALPRQHDPVVIGDPGGSLTFARLEAKAVHECCYPAGRFLGSAGPGWAGSETGAGTSDEVLALLPTADRAGASVLHLGCHANVVGTAPGQSYLALAGSQPLRVDAILRRASGRPRQAPGGLVTLAACRSDLAAQDYDEALTLSTAFLAGGAVTVVGARWDVLDVCPDARDEDVGVFGGEDDGVAPRPRRRVPAGPWCAGWRRGGQSVVISVTAERVLVSSTMALRSA